MPETKRAAVAWNDLTREQMEAQLLRQAQEIGRMREALERTEQYLMNKKIPRQNILPHVRLALRQKSA